MCKNTAIDETKNWKNITILSSLYNFQSCALLFFPTFPIRNNPIYNGHFHVIPWGLTPRLVSTSNTALMTPIYKKIKVAQGRLNHHAGDSQRSTPARKLNLVASQHTWPSTHNQHTRSAPSDHPRQKQLQ